MTLLIGNVSKEYEKCEKLRKEDVIRIMRWIDLQPHLPKMSEMQIVLFLYHDNFSIETTKQSIAMFFTMRTQIPEFFSQRNPSNINLNNFSYTILPKPTQEGYRIIHAKLIDTNPNNFNSALQFTLLDMTVMLLLNEEGTMPGQVVIYDLTGFSFAHFSKINRNLVKKFFYYLQNCMPVNIKGMHFINPVNVVYKMFTIYKPFIKSDLINVMHTHTNLESIYNFIPKECLPKDYDGGEAPSIEELWSITKQKLIDNAEFFMAEEKQVVDESLKPSTRSLLPAKEIDEIFGMDGTWKKLDID